MISFVVVTLTLFLFFFVSFLILQIKFIVILLNYKLNTKKTNNKKLTKNLTMKKFSTFIISCPENVIQLLDVSRYWPV